MCIATNDLIIYLRGSNENLDVLLEMLERKTDNISPWNTPDKYTPLKWSLFFHMQSLQHLIWFILVSKPSA